MANSIRVRSASEYIINVNDQGDTISFDTSDVTLTSRIFKMFERIDELTKKYEAEAKEIDSRPDETLFEVGEGEAAVKATRNQRDAAKLIEDFYTEARAAIDIVFGKDACQKIFGDNNYYEMFDDLMEQMKPHYEKMGVNAEKLKKSAAQKYAPNREARRILH